MNKSRRCLSSILIVAALTLVGCAHRSEKATNVEDDGFAHSDQPWKEESLTSEPHKAAARAYDPVSFPVSEGDNVRGRNKKGDKKNETLEDSPDAPSKQWPNVQPAPQKVSRDPRLEVARLTFEHAQKAQLEGAYTEAAEQWKRFLDEYTALPGYERAQYNFALTSFHLGRLQESAEMLKGLLQLTEDPVMAIDARVLLAEAFLGLGQANYDEALSLTFEVLPDTEAETSAGLHRRKNAVGVSGLEPDLIQKIRLYTLRGRIFASLNNEKLAQVALTKAQMLLEGSKKNKISQDLRTRLKATWAWRQLEVKWITCRKQTSFPARLSEAEFLAYADAHYGCVDPTRKWFCDVWAAHDQQITQQALIAFKELALWPLKLNDDLPKPARPIMKADQRKYYETEMRQLIEKTVTERSQAYRNLDSCAATNLF